MEIEINSILVVVMIVLLLGIIQSVRAFFYDLESDNTLGAVGSAAYVIICFCLMLFIGVLWQ